MVGGGVGVGVGGWGGCVGAGAFRDFLAKRWTPRRLLMICSVLHLRDTVLTPFLPHSLARDETQKQQKQRTSRTHSPPRAPAPPPQPQPRRASRYAVTQVRRRLGSRRTHRTLHCTPMGTRTRMDVAMDMNTRTHPPHPRATAQDTPPSPSADCVPRRAPTPGTHRTTLTVHLTHPRAQRATS